MPLPGYTTKTMKEHISDKLEYTAAKLGISVQDLLDQMADDYIIRMHKGELKAKEPAPPAAVSQVIERLAMDKAGLILHRKDDRNASGRNWTSSDDSAYEPLYQTDILMQQYNRGERRVHPEGFISEAIQ